MAAKLTFEYDVVGDVMYLEKCPSYREQDSDEIHEVVVGRMNPNSGEVESLEILFYSHLIISRDPLRLEIPVAPGSICGQPAAPEFHCLIQPGSPWLTFPPDAEIVELYIPGWTESETASEAPAPATDLAAAGVAPPTPPTG